MIHGAQSLAGKILVSKNLRAENRQNDSQNGTDVGSAHRHGLDNDCAIGILGKGCSAQKAGFLLWMIVEKLCVPPFEKREGGSRAIVDQ
jgi:hypothetical protein